MRKRTLGVFLLAGLAMSGAGAFTASNTMTAVEGGTKNVAGYGAATVTGATVTAIDYTHSTTDGSVLTQVDFVASGSLVGKQARVTLWDTATDPDTNEGSYACDTGTAQSAAAVVLGVTLTEASTLFSCTISNEPIADFNSIGITVNN
jgi:hypothetical protein